jgi:glycosyltransferase involved in cell wall biosynthesis
MTNRLPRRSNPLLSIIIPTHNRPQLLQRAVKSALEQTVEELEVIVIDDGSAEPVNLPEQPRLRMIQLPINRGVSAVRNVGARVAHGRWIAHLDDDDQLLPNFAEVSLHALAHTTLPKPVAALSGLEAVNKNGALMQTHLPPTFPRGSHFQLEEIKPGQSFFSKQTLVVEREVLLSIGGFDESFSALSYTEMFLRLNPVCSILGTPIVTYRQFIHEGPRVSHHASRRQSDFNRLMRKHGSLFNAHPRMFAEFVLIHAYALHDLGQRRKAFFSLFRALQLHPSHSIARIASSLWRRWLW